MLTYLSEVSQGGSPLSRRQDYILVQKINEANFFYIQNEQLHFMNMNTNVFFVKYSISAYWLASYELWKWTVSRLL